MLYFVLSISKQAVHKMLDMVNKRKDERLQLLNYIHQIREEHPSMGCRDMYYKLAPAFIGRDAFEEFCKQEGLMSKMAKNYRMTTDSNGVKRFDNLIINTSISGVNQVWTSDITYYDLGDRFYYLTFIQDAYSRKILGYAISDNLRTEFTTLTALKLAIKSRGIINLSGLIFHSDGGGQYYDKEFLKLTGKSGIRNSMCIYPWENGKAERLNGVIKNNYLRYRDIKSYKDLKREVDRTVQLYNQEKPHIKLDRKSPIAFERNIV